MNSNDSPYTERFHRDHVGQPFLTAVLELCTRTGKSLDQMELHTLHEIAELADDTYGDRLPEFWRIWKDWYQQEPRRALGDLEEPI